MNVLVSGGLGFIGSNLIRLILAEEEGWNVTNVDLVTYAANPANLAGIHEEHGRYRFIRGDVADRELMARLFSESDFDAVIHCAAESHVDRSIEDGGQFLRTNVEGTLVLLEASTTFGVDRYLQMSTDEVYGTLVLDDPAFTEETPLSPRSPYAASKAAADHLVQAYRHTHALDAVVTRCSNNYGPRQHPEKLIPLMITSALVGRRLPVYGDGRQRRDWIHVEDHCRGVLTVLKRGRAGEVYNFGGAAERENLEIVDRVVELTGADPDLVTHVTDRPGHDWRYAMNFTKVREELGWTPAHSFQDGLEETVAWYRDNPDWWAETAARAHEASRRMIEEWGAR